MTRLMVSSKKSSNVKWAYPLLFAGLQFCSRCFLGEKNFVMLSGLPKSCLDIQELITGSQKRYKGEIMSDLNDPRVFFAAERTLMAWTRTAVALMAFGFAIERFGLFLHMFLLAQGDHARRNGSFWVGASFILFGVVVAVLSVLQYRSVLKTLKPVEIPEGYWVNIGTYTNVLVAAFGIVIIGYFIFGLD